MASEIKTDQKALENSVAGSSDELNAAIFERLRLSFQPILAEPIPQRFIDLIRKLEKRDADDAKARGNDK